MFGNFSWTGGNWSQWKQDSIPFFPVCIAKIYNKNWVNWGANLEEAVAPVYVLIVNLYKKACIYMFTGGRNDDQFILIHHVHLSCKTDLGDQGIDEEKYFFCPVTSKITVYWAFFMHVLVGNCLTDLSLNVSLGLKKKCRREILQSKDAVSVLFVH